MGVRRGKPLTEGGRTVEDMANAAEVIERLARSDERARILLMAKGCKDLEELLQKLEAQMQSKDS